MNKLISTARKRETGSATTFGSTHCNSQTQLPLAAVADNVVVPKKYLQIPRAAASFLCINTSQNMETKKPPSMEIMAAALVIPLQ